MRTDHPFEVTFLDDMKIRLAPSSASSGVYIGGGSSDQEVARPFRALLKRGMVAIDCGAHIGEYTLLFAHLVGPEGEVHAFEPDPRAFSYLEWNVKHNNLANVRINNIALGDRIGHESFALRSDATVSSLARFSELPSIGWTDVETTTLDDYVRENGLETIAALKIDVEGAEVALLAGASSVLAERPPQLVCVECDGDDHDAVPNVLEKLQQSGYDTINVSREGHLHPHVVALRDAS